MTWTGIETDRNVPFTGMKSVLLVSPGSGIALPGLVVIEYVWYSGHGVVHEFLTYPANIRTSNAVLVLVLVLLYAASSSRPSADSVMFCIVIGGENPIILVPFVGIHMV